MSTPAEGLSGRTALVTGTAHGIGTAIADALAGAGAAVQRVDRDIADRHLMSLTLSCDHRILYVASAAQVLSGIRDLLEQPFPLAL